MSDYSDKGAVATRPEYARFSLNNDHDLIIFVGIMSPNVVARPLSA